MARRWVVSDGTFAREVDIGAAKIAVGGLVKSIKKACVVENGVIRQFYPPAAGTGSDPRIIWNVISLSVIESVIDPSDSIASIIFSRSLGTYTYKNNPNPDGVAQYLNPPATAAGQYLIKVDQVSGTALTGTLGTWIDLYSAAEHTWSLDETAIGSSSAVANISISQDNGAGSPVAATTIIKSVTFISEVIQETKIVWTDEQYDLVEIREGENADCILTFTPAGYAIGDAFTSGSFIENWHVDAPDPGQAGLVDRDGNTIIDYQSLPIEAPFNGGDFTVNATLVSGTAPTGSDLGVDLTLDATREWTLLASTGEDLACELDVTISDGTVSKTKRITMNSERTEASATPVWTTTAWTLSDVAFPQPLGLTVDYTMSFPVSGTATGRCDNSEGGGIQETEAWLPGGETAADYEVRITKVSGSANLVSGHVFGTYYNLAADVDFVIQSSTKNNLATSVVQLSVRKIGDLAVDKLVTIQRAGDNGETPP